MGLSEPAGGIADPAGAVPPAFDLAAFGRLGKIDQIKMLREMAPGTSLSQAKTLVDALGASPLGAGQLQRYLRDRAGR